MCYHRKMAGTKWAAIHPARLIIFTVKYQNPVSRLFQTKVTGDFRYFYKL